MGRRQDADLDLALLLPSFVPLGTLKLGEGCYVGFSEPDQHVQQIFGTASLVLDAVIGYLCGPVYALPG